MTDQETIARFIFLRWQGWSFNRIAVELNVSKPTPGPGASEICNAEKNGKLPVKKWSKFGKNAVNFW